MSNIFEPNAILKKNQILQIVLQSNGVINMSEMITDRLVFSFVTLISNLHIFSR